MARNSAGIKICSLCSHELTGRPKSDRFCSLLCQTTYLREVSRRYRRSLANDPAKLARHRDLRRAADAKRPRTPEQRAAGNAQKRHRFATDPIVREKNRERHRLEHLRKRAIVDAVKELGLLDCKAFRVLSDIGLGEHQLYRLRKRAVVEAVKQLGLLDVDGVYKTIGALILATPDNAKQRQQK